MLGFALILGLAGAPDVDPAQIVRDTIFAKGQCDSKSEVAIGKAQATPLSCDIATITRTPRGTVLVQFGDHATGRMIGFAGTIEGKQAFGADPVQVLGTERLYWEAGHEPLQADRGSCFLNWKGKDGKLDYIICSGGAPYKGTRIWVQISFVVS